MAKEITEIVLEKARDLIKWVKRFTRGAKYTGVAGAIGDSLGKSRGKVGEIEDSKSAISGTTRRTREYQHTKEDLRK